MLFNCQNNPTQLTVQDLWDNPAAVADFLTDDRRRAAGLSQQQQQQLNNASDYRTNRLY